MDVLERYIIDGGSGGSIHAQRAKQLQASRLPDPQRTIATPTAAFPPRRRGTTTTVSTRVCVNMATHQPPHSHDSHHTTGSSSSGAASSSDDAHTITILMPPRDKQESRLRAIRKNNSERARRYRKRKKEKVGNTLDDVEALREQITLLTQRKQLFEERVLAIPLAASNRALELVHQYFGVFRFGMHQHFQCRSPVFSSIASNMVQSATDSTLVASPPFHATAPLRQPSQQEQFLQVMAHPDVLFGDLVGVHPLLEQWRLYSHCHASIRLERVSVTLMHVGDQPVVASSGVLHLRYARHTIAALFPHALANEALVQKLIGKEIHLGFTDTFRFDASGRMVRYELVPGLVAALYEAVGNLQDVAMLLGGALIEPDAVIKPHISSSEGGGANVEKSSTSSVVVDESGDEDVDIEDAATTEGNCSGSPIMDIQFILS